jgi:glutamine amidotransferase
VNNPITIVDYGMGNIASVKNMIEYIGGKAIVSSSPEQIAESEKIILPGVGAFDAGVRALQQSGMEKAIEIAINDNNSFILGICLGMQLLMESSEEGCLPGLGLVPGRVKRFQLNDFGLRVPHMGWNSIQQARTSRLFDSNDEEQRFYFVHSYHVECDETQDITGITHYGYDFTSAFEHKRVLGVQFHPEKSHRFGMNLLKRFLEV